MASGWEKDVAIQEQIDASVEDAVRVASNQLTDGESLNSFNRRGSKDSQLR